MPELDSVEETRRRIEVHCANKVIEDIELKEDKIVLKATQDEILNLKGRAISSVHRRGKYFWIELDQGPHPLMHLGMTGSVKFCPPPPLSLFLHSSTTLHSSQPSHPNQFLEKGGEKLLEEESSSEKEEGSSLEDFQKETKPKIAKEWPPPYWKVIFKFKGVEMAFVNKRRLGRFWLKEFPLTEPPVSKLGFDPYLEKAVTPKQFHSRLSSKRSPIKAVLMDQAFCAGLGNWMVDEVLYQSSLHPCTYTSTLEEAESAEILKNIYHVVKTAVKARKTGRTFPEDWLFHNRWSKAQKKKTPKTSKGEEIEFVTVGGRTSAFVREKQKLNEESERKWKEAQEKVAAAKKKKAAKKKEAEEDDEDSPNPKKRAIKKGKKAKKEGSEDEKNSLKPKKRAVKKGTRAKKQELKEDKEEYLRPKKKATKKGVKRRTSPKKLNEEDLATNKETRKRKLSTSSKNSASSKKHKAGDGH